MNRIVYQRRCSFPASQSPSSTGSIDRTRIRSNNLQNQSLDGTCAFHQLVTMYEFRETANNATDLNAECLKERKWWCFLLSSIFTFLAGLFIILIFRAFSFLCSGSATSSQAQAQLQNQKGQFYLPSTICNSFHHFFSASASPKSPDRQRLSEQLPQQTGKIEIVSICGISINVLALDIQSLVFWRFNLIWS